MNQDVPVPAWDGVGVGVALVVVLHLVAAGFGLAFGDAIFGDYGALLYVAFIGVTQLAWVLPAAFVLAMTHRMATLKGLAIAAGITFLLNLSCFGLVTLGG